ncbi:hypothetical protein GYMLUDRAFT_49974 [Collybiopsis luxurians FD-317 M1]|uniref:RING-14 protein n=1 Tax=Collybiopsis luxurians FD-317 M1 TaxID=944289 RepID=A0A0D0C3I8_9AGAR|nr:hypothetical protein GYMLUDRAFT_49974 [Collybiopsis luxurians FD-317 M1]
MHFSKTYAKLLLDLPPELRQNAIQYRQLKKLINQVVLELDELGLGPDVLHKLLVDGNGEGQEGKGLSARNHPKVVYEFNSDSGKIEPRLRIWLSWPLPTPVPSHSSTVPVSRVSSVDSEASSSEGGELTSSSSEGFGMKNISLLWALQRNAAVQNWAEDSPQITEVADTEEPQSTTKHPIVFSDSREIIIPLVKDSAFFELLSTALHSLSDRLSSLYGDFAESLETLSQKIGDSARPVSESRRRNFHAYSALSNAGTISSPSKSAKSDLYSWREIFALYIESEVFESLHESSPGQLSIDESEKRLKLFADRVTSRGLGDKRKLKLKESREALEGFLELNMFILNVKKLEQANAEATRKILKKHAKRTALPLPPSQEQNYYSQETSLAPRPVPSTSSTSLTSPFPSYPSSDTISSLPRTLVQALSTTLLPIIPHIDDYSCIICTNIAFKPIRLGCGHLFCVRCLVKMQKRRQGDCPMCRAPTVERADRSNVDWALLNFMQDWFPIESREKLKASEKEATEEQLREMGIDPDRLQCVVM